MSEQITSRSIGISRRALLRGTTVVLSAPVLAISMKTAMAKTPQATAAYQASPKNDRSCGTCANFEPPSSCKIVEGPVSAEGWCKLWSKKTG